MSKEAMQAAALYAASGALPPGSALGCLTWMAYYSRDSEPPYRSSISPKTLEGLLNLEPRQVRKIIETLKRVKISDDETLLDTDEPDEQDKRRRIFALHLPEPEPVAYTRLFAPPEYRQHSAYKTGGIGSTVPTNDDIGSTVPTNDDIGSTVPTNEGEYRHSRTRNIGTPGHEYRHSSAASTYKGEKEKREEKEESHSQQLERLRAQIVEAERRAEKTPPPPPLPRATWRHRVSGLASCE